MENNSFEKIDSIQDDQKDKIKDERTKIYEEEKEVDQNKIKEQNKEKFVILSDKEVLENKNILDELNNDQKKDKLISEDKNGKLLDSVEVKLDSKNKKNIDKTNISVNEKSEEIYLDDKFQEKVFLNDNLKNEKSEENDDVFLNRNEEENNLEINSNKKNDEESNKIIGMKKIDSKEKISDLIINDEKILKNKKSDKEELNEVSKNEFKENVSDTLENEFDKKKIETHSNELDEQPIKPSINGFDEQKFKPAKNELDKQSIKPGINELDEQPIKPAKNELDEQPIKSAKNELDEQPIKPAKNELDDQPIESAKNELDEQPIKPAKNELDEQPIKPAKNELDEQPIKPAKNELDEQPIKPAKNELDEQPIKPAKNELYEQPIKPVKNELDEQPIKPAKNELDDQPIKSAKNELDELNEDLANPSSNFGEKPKIPPLRGKLNRKPVSKLKAKPSELEEKPIKSTNKEIEEKPITSTTIPIGEEPIKPNTSIPNEEKDENEMTPPKVEIELGANAYPPGFDPNELNKDIEETLETKLKSPDFKKRVIGFQELLKWDDKVYKKEDFLRGLHIMVKEKNPVVIPEMITAIVSLITSPQKDELLESLNFPKFISAYAEHLMANAKKPKPRAAVLEFIPKLFDAYEDKSLFKDQLKALLKTIKMKIQENALVIMLELIKAGKLEELEFLNGYFPFLETLSTSRTVTIKNTVRDIYVETFLWMGDGLRALMKNLKPAQMEEFNKIFSAIDPKDMKTMKSKDGKAKTFDAYEFAKEEDLPKEYAEDEWVDEILQLKKWKERMAELEKVLGIVKKISKLNPKTNTRAFIHLTKKLFEDSIVLNQVLAMKILACLASSLRKAFNNEAKQIFTLLLVNLKQKNRSLSDQIIKTCEKLFFAITFEDVYDDFKENLKGKNNHKVLNVLLVVGVLIDKTDRVKTPATAVKIVKLILFLIDGSDLKVRDKASQIIAKLKDNYNDKIQPLLSDLNSQKMGKILNYCTNPEFKVKIEEETKVVDNEEEKNKKGKKDRNQRNNTSKSSKIAQMRENLFSNKTIKISETTEFSKFLETNLKNLSEMTKDFKEVSNAQCNEIILLIDEISLKVSKKAFIQYSREVMAKFYIEQICSKYTDEIYDSIIRYLTSKNKLVNTHIFLENMFVVISDKSIKVTRDLLLVIIKIMERGLSNKGNLRTINHKSFVEFLKANFTSQTVHSSIKSIIVSMMRTLQKKFGDRVLQDYPSSIIKDFESQNKEIEKNFNKTLEKLNDKNIDKKRNALLELSNLVDFTKIVLYWNTKDFLNYLKKELIGETQGSTLKFYVKIMINYLEIYRKSKNDFSLKNYLYVFHAVISQYYDQENKKEIRNPEKQGALEEIFNKTVQELTASLIFNSLISDTNAMSWKEQILHFYLQYGSEIDVKVKFITFIINLITSNYGGEVKTLLDNALLMLKNTDNDAIIIKGNENREIRSIWQKKEEDVLFEERYIKGNKVFEDISFFNAAKTFIEQSLRMEGFSFYDKNIETIKILPNDNAMKIKLAYYYLRSIENISFISIHIFQEIRKINLNLTKPDCKLMALKILINLLKNNYLSYEEAFYQNVKERFLILFNNLNYKIDSLVRLLNLTGFEITFLEIVLNNEEGLQVQPSAINSPVRGGGGNNMNSTLNNISVYNPKTPVVRDKDPQSHIDSQSYHTITNQFKKTRQNQRINDEFSQGDNRSYANLGGARSNFHQELSPRSMSRQSNSRRQIYSQNPNRQDNPNVILEDHFNKMLTFDLDCYKEANDFMESLMENEDGINFLISNSDKIIRTYEEIIKTIFNTGINYDCDKTSYDLIFQPLYKFWSLPGFLESITQESLNLIVEQLLLRLVFANNEKVSREKNENAEEEEHIALAGYIVKSFNTLILRIIENSDINNLFTSYFKVIFDCRTGRTDKIYKLIDNLSFKCIMRILKSIKKYMDKIDPERIFILIYKFYEQNFRIDPSESKTINKTFSVLIKKIISYSELDYIIDCYEKAFGDQSVPYILEPIQLAQEKLGQIQKPSNKERQRSIGECDKKLLEIVELINSQEDAKNINFFVNEIKNMLITYPGLKFEAFGSYFENPQFYKYICREIEKSFSGKQTPKHMDDFLNKSNMEEVHEFSKKNKYR